MGGHNRLVVVAVLGLLSALPSRIDFGDIYSGAFSLGVRIFDVTIDRTLVLDNCDVYAEAETGIGKTFTTTVTDSNIDIDFGHVTQNPAVKAIGIRSGP